MAAPTRGPPRPVTPGLSDGANARNPVIPGAARPPRPPSRENRITSVSLTARPDVLEFFDRYQKGADTSDPDVVRDCFAETFLDLDPRGAGPVPREALIQALPGRAQPFATIGVEALELTELSEQPLDELHTMVTTTWRARIAPDAPDAAPLELPSQF